MTDVGASIAAGINAFLHTQLAKQAELTWDDQNKFLGSIPKTLQDGPLEVVIKPPANYKIDAPLVKGRLDRLKEDITKLTAIGKEIKEALDKQITTISTHLDKAIKALDVDDVSFNEVSQSAVHICTVLMAMNEAYVILARELARERDDKGKGGDVDKDLEAALLKMWDPLIKPFKNLVVAGQTTFQDFGRTALKTDDLIGKIGQSLKLETTGGYKLVGTLANMNGQLGPVKLDQTDLETFLQFSRREITNPVDSEKPDLVEERTTVKLPAVGGEEPKEEIVVKWYKPDEVNFGIRIKTHLEPGLTSNPLLKKVMPGSGDPKTTDRVTVSLDTDSGFYLGDGRKDERAVLPVRWDFPHVELREMALGIVRNDRREVTGLELTHSIAAEIAGAVGLQVGGVGMIFDLGGLVSKKGMLGESVDIRWPDALGFRIKTDPVSGGGYAQRVIRTYTGSDGKPHEVVEFGGTLQLKVLSAGIHGIVLVTPDPFSMVVVMGVHFPVAIPLAFGFTLNGVGGMLALDRGLDLVKLNEGMKEGVIDRMLFPEDPVADAPKILEKLAYIFPPRDGGFAIGLSAELGWGPEHLLTIKLAAIFLMPDPTLLVLGSVRARVVPKKKTKDEAVKPTADIRAELYIAIDKDHLETRARIATGSYVLNTKVSGDVGMYIGWTGEPEFEYSIGGFHPSYKELTGKAPRLGELERITIDLSPNKDIKIEIQAYFALTAGSVQAGIKGSLDADFDIARVRGHIQLDMIFIWSPRFRFRVSIEMWVNVEVFGGSVADIRLRGQLDGTTPYSLQGHVHVDVWFLPTFDEDLGPLEWGEKSLTAAQKVDALKLAVEALNKPESWTIGLPAHAANMVTLAAVEDKNLNIAHPMAAIEAKQTAVPLGVKITHIGQAPVTANQVLLGEPTHTGGAFDAVSEARAPFAPGHFFDLTDEKLIARSGYEELVGGCRIAAGTMPALGKSGGKDVRYRTYLRNEPDDEFTGDFAKLDGIFARGSVVGRARHRDGNPYMPDVKASEAIRVAPFGASRIADAANGADLTGSVASGAGQFAAFGALSATEADLITAAANAADFSTTRTSLRN